MTVINRRDVRKTIRSKLPSRLAKVFVENHHHLMLINSKTPHANSVKSLNRACGYDRALVDELHRIYQSLHGVVAVFNERSGPSKTVISRKSMLNYLTDGESHLSLYPEVDF